MSGVAEAHSCAHRRASVLTPCLPSASPLPPGPRPAPAASRRSWGSGSSWRRPRGESCLSLTRPATTGLKQGGWRGTAALPCVPALPTALTALQITWSGSLLSREAAGIGRQLSGQLAVVHDGRCLRQVPPQPSALVQAALPGAFSFCSPPAHCTGSSQHHQRAPDTAGALCPTRSAALQRPPHPIHGTSVTAR